MIAVARRELRIIRQRPVYILGSVAVLAFCSIFCLTFFRDGMPHDLPIAVVDDDNSSMSRNFKRQLDATQLGKVVEFDSFSGARAAMQSGKVTSIIVIPEGMYRDVQTQRRPRLDYYINGLYFVSGALAYKDILQMVNLTNGAVQREMLRARGVSDDAIMGMIKPITVDTHQIGNVYTNYGYYLSNVLLPVYLEMIVIIVLIYSLGMELKYGTSRHLMKTGGNSILTVLTGKLLVFTILFSALGLIMIIMLYHWAKFPIAGSIWNMFLDVLLLILASESVAVFIVGCLPVPRLALSIGALYSVLAFSFSGFTLPVEVLPPYIRGLSAAFPMRHYYIFYTHEVIFGNGFPGWWREVLHMLYFLVLPLPVLYRLKNAYLKQNFPTN